MKAFDDTIVGDGLGSPWIAAVSLFLDQGLRIPHEHIPPGSFGRRGVPVDDGKIDAFRLTTGELRFEALLRGRILGEDDQA